MRTKTLYERPRIDCLIDATVAYPLALVVAGAGFGKTTAARQWMHGPDMASAWVGLTSGDADVAWDKLCDAIEPLSASAADEMRATGTPRSPWVISRIVKIARSACLKPVVICIDDCQYLPSDSPLLELIKTLVFEQVANLHILMLSRTWPNLPFGTFVSKGLCSVIEQDILCFDEKETAGYLSMRGLRLTKNAVAQICETSGGWVSAIYLIAEGVRAGTSINERTSIEKLFDENLMAPLSDIDCELLYRMSQLEPLPGECAIQALGSNHAEELLASLEDENCFVTKDEKGLYHFHPLLREYLVKHCPDDDAQKSVYRRAGLWYLGQPNLYRSFSVSLFEKAGCVNELLERIDAPNVWSLNYFDMDAIYAMVDRLPEDTCTKRPFPYLQIGFYLMLSGDPHKVKVGTKLLQTMQEYFSSHEHPYRERILGEIMVISRVFGFGNIPEGTEPLEVAAQLLGGRPSQILLASDPFTFGLPMLSESEWMGRGELDAAVERCQYNPYELVTDGFGRGSGLLIKAEAAMLRCQMDEARIFAEQAYAEACSAGQWFVMASAHFVLMRRALYLGLDDHAIVQIAAIRNLISEAEGKLEIVRITIPALREVALLSQCFIATSLYRKDDIPADFLDGTHVNKLVGMGIPEVFSARAMLACGDALNAERMCHRLDSAPAVCQEARLMRLIIESLAREQLYGKGTGAPSMLEALAQAQQDNVLLPFAETPSVYSVLHTSDIEKHCDAGFLGKIDEVCKSHAKISATRPSAAAAKLTKRELEVLRLAARGFTRAQIAVEINTEESTVKKHLSAAYRKLGAANRTEALRIARIEGLL